MFLNKKRLKFIRLLKKKIVCHFFWDIIFIGYLYKIYIRLFIKIYIIFPETYLFDILIYILNLF